MSDLFFSDEYFMKAALNEANKAFDADEVPVGAIIVSNNKIIARGHNLTETLNDATAHAEMIAFTSATEFLGAKYLNDCILYVTLEPCIMCAGAAYWSQIGGIIYGANDDKGGYKRVNTNILHPKTKVVSGILENECSALISNFFKNKRS